MEDYANTKIDTFDELMSKCTRRELEELALKYGIESLGGTKSQLAEYIMVAMKKQKEPLTSTPKVSQAPLQSAPMMSQEPPKSTPQATQELPKFTPQVSLKEASMIEKPKSAAKPAGFGKKGVLAKANAIDNKAADIKKAGREIREQGIREMNRGINAQIKENHEAAAKIHSGAKVIQSGIDSQIKENHEAAAKIHSGAMAIRSSQEKMSREFQKAGKNIREDGCRNLQNGLAQFRRDLGSQIKENREAVSRLNSGAVSLQNEIHRYQEQDLKNYVRDFYYG
ncbi:MAG: hypothetical protein E4G89_00905 [Methanothrix sp.]|nr:MAG: hypothetical protein E4G89_00905 [Methanothrix sp.]